MLEDLKIAALKLDMKFQKSQLEKLEKDIKLKNEQLKILDENKTTKSDRMNANFLYEDIGILQGLAIAKRSIIKKRDKLIKALMVHKTFKKEAKKQSKQISIPDISYEDMFTK